MGSPFSTGFKSTIDPFLNWQEHVLTLLQVSFDVERATRIRITLTEIENLALAISPGSSSNLVTKGPLLVPSPYSLDPCRELWEGTVSQRFGHPRVLGIPIPISLAFWASPVGDAQNADHFHFA